MVLSLLTNPSATAGRVVPAAARLLDSSAPAAVGAAAAAAAATARAGVRSADAAVRVARVARHALPGRPRPWRSGTRAHLALRPATPAEERRAGGITTRARRVAAALAEHPDV